MPLTARICEWNQQRGFGYLDHDGKRLFLHIREITTRERRPELGDQIQFVIGADRQGRPCAQQAVLLGTAGRLKAVHALILAFLILPGLAIHRALGVAGLTYAAVWLL